MLIVPKNWREFQHYKDRCPPWIRLHRKLLDDRDFHRLPVASRALAPMLWLLASESVDGVIDADMDELAFRLRSNEKDVRSALLPLLERGFFETLQDDSNVLARRKQLAVPETETETETETEAETEAELSGKPADAGKPGAKPSKSAQVWEAYRAAYNARYTVDPVRNARVNAILAQVVGKVGDEAAAVAAFYVQHDDSFYVKNGHSAGLLLRDAEKLRTEWITGRRIGSSRAPPAEPAWRSEQRERTRQAAPGIAANRENVFDVEVRDVAADRLG